MTNTLFNTLEKQEFKYASEHAFGPNGILIDPFSLNCFMSCLKCKCVLNP